MDWPGFRGGGLEGRRETAVISFPWNLQRDTAWKTPLPGIGHSSPVLSGPAVYVTTATESRAQPLFLLVLRWILLLLTAGYTAGVMGFTVRRSLYDTSMAGDVSSDPERGARHPPFRLAAMPLLVVTACLLVLYGESVLDFGRAVERGWFATVLMGTVCLGTVGVYPPAASRMRSVSGLLLIAFAGLMVFLIPDPVHTVQADPFSDSSLGLYAAIALPFLAGCFMLITDPGRRRIPIANRGAVSHVRRRALMAVGVAGTIAAIIIIASLAARIRDDGGAGASATVSIGSRYEPRISPGMVAVVPAALVSLLAFRRKRRSRQPVLAAVETLLAAAAFGIAGAAVIERVISHSHYLSYLAGMPAVTPLLGRTSPAILGAVAAASAIIALSRFRRHEWPAPPVLSTMSRGTALLLAVVYALHATVFPANPRLYRHVVSIDRSTGQINWVSRGLSGPRGILHSDNSPATPTPVTDGRRIYAYFGACGLMAVDRHGRRLWVNTRLPFDTREGVASSPILAGDRVIVLSESDAGSYLASLDRETGRIAWRTDRNRKTHPYAGNCRTPTVRRINGREVVLVWGYEDLTGYDARSGREIWSIPIGDLGTGGNPVASIASDDRRLYLTGPAKAVCVRVAERAGVKPIVEWERDMTDGAQCASPVVTRGLLLGVSDGGSIFCLDTRDGEERWRIDTGRQHYASPVVVRAGVLFIDTEGRATLVARSPALRILSTSNLGEKVFATPAIAGGSLYLRSFKHVYRIGKTAGEDPRPVINGD